MNSCFKTRFATLSDFKLHEICTSATSSWKHGYCTEGCKANVRLQNSLELFGKKAVFFLVFGL